MQHVVPTQDLQSTGPIKEYFCETHPQVLYLVLFLAVLILAFTLKAALTSKSARMDEASAKQEAVQAPTTGTTEVEGAEPTPVGAATSLSGMPSELLPATQNTECRDFNLRSQCQEKPCRMTEDFVQGTSFSEVQFESVFVRQTLLPLDCPS